MIATLFRAATLFSAFLLLPSCRQDEFHCSVSDDFTVTERGQLEYAAWQWNNVARAPIFLDDGQDCWIVRDTNLERFDPQGPRPGTSIVGFYDGRGTIYVRWGMNGIELIAVAMHEMGHMHGLRHIDDEEKGIMHRHGGFPELSPADLGECRRVNACR